MSILREQIQQEFAPKQVNIAEFCESEEYCGKRLYPFQRILLKLIFLEELAGWEEDLLDFWIRGGRGHEITISPEIRQRVQYCRDRKFEHFSEVDFIGGRRSSKGFVTGLAGTYKLHKVQQIPDPGTYYNIDLDKEIYFTCVAASLDQAKKFQFADLYSSITRCVALAPHIAKAQEESVSIKTQSDAKNMLRMEKLGLKIGRDFSKLRVRPLAANADTLRGATSIFMAQPLNAGVLTPTGWTTIGELEAGSTVVGSDGLPQRVKAIHPRGVLEGARLMFSDGSSTVSSLDHIWTLYSRTGFEQTSPLRDFIEGGLHHQNGKQPPRAKWSLPANPVIVSPEAQLPLDPYLLGALLGDGCLGAETIRFDNTDESIVAAVTSVLPEGHTLRRYSSGQYGIVTSPRAARNEVRRAIDELGLRHGSHTKFIPSLYKTASPSQRRSLLQGLLDTDGSVKGTSVRYASVSQQLAKDVVELVRSLGGYATIYHNSNGAYEVCISDLDARCLFRSERKVARCGVYSRYTHRRRTLVGVEPVEAREMRCITVENPDGLYITDDLIVTHNCFDEMAFMMPGESNQSAAKVYEAAEPSLAQFGPAALLFCNSSPYTKLGQFYEQAEHAMRASDHEDGWYPMRFALKFPSWALYDMWWKDPERRFANAIMVSPDWADQLEPNEPSSKLDELSLGKRAHEQLQEKSNPDTYAVERRSNWAEVLDAYLNPNMVDRAYSGVLPDGRKHERSVDGTYKYTYRMHCDPSSTTAGFGFAVAHIEEFPDETGFFPGGVARHVVFDLVHRWNPQDFPGRTINYLKVQADLADYLDLYRPEELTFDQYNSTGLIQGLREVARKRKIHGVSIHEVTATNKVNHDRWEVFKTALNLGLIHVPPNCINPVSNANDAEQSAWELKFLREISTATTKRVDKQDEGPIQTKDIADCICEVTNKFLASYIGDFRKTAFSLGLESGAEGGYQLGGRQPGGPTQGFNGAERFGSFYSQGGPEQVSRSRGIDPNRRRH